MVKNIERIIIWDFGITYESFLYLSMDGFRIRTCVMNIWLPIPFLFRWPHKKKTFSIQMLVQMKRLLVGHQIQLFRSLPIFHSPCFLPKCNFRFTHRKGGGGLTNEINRKWTQLNQVNELSEVFFVLFSSEHPLIETGNMTNCGCKIERERIPWWTNKVLQIFTCNRRSGTAGGRRRVLKSTQATKVSNNRREEGCSG